MNSILEYIYAVKPLFLNRGKRELRKKPWQFILLTYRTSQVWYV